MYNRRRGNLFPAIMLTIFLLSFAVLLILNARWLYYIDIIALDLEKSSGMDVASIKANYDALIRYNQIWQRGELQFPSLPMSGTARIHFQEVKRIFDVVWCLCIVSFIFSLVSILRRWRSRQYDYLRLAGIFSLAIPVILGALAVINWDKFFILFHKLFFRNDYWLFDPVTDPVIRILPDAYFLHCVIGILLCILAGSLICFYISGRRKGRRR